VVIDEAGEASGAVATAGAMQVGVSMTVLVLLVIRALTNSQKVVPIPPLHLARRASTCRLLAALYDLSSPPPPALQDVGLRASVARSSCWCGVACESWCMSV